MEEIFWKKNQKKKHVNIKNEAHKHVWQIF